MNDISRDELLEVIRAVVERLAEPEDASPTAACIFSDAPCDGGTKYAINDE